MTRSSFVPSSFAIVSLRSFFCSKERTSSSAIGRLLFFFVDGFDGAAFAGLGAGFEVEGTGGFSCFGFFSFFFVLLLSFGFQHITAFVLGSQDVASRDHDGYGDKVNDL